MGFLMMRLMHMHHMGRYVSSLRYPHSKRMGGTRVLLLTRQTYHVS